MSFEFPADEPPRPAPVNASRAGCRWVTPGTIDEACAVVRDAGDLRVRLVAANTSFGIYPREFLEAQLLVDIGKITELHGVAEEPPGLRAGAGATYAELLEVLAARDDAPGSARGAAELMARRTAGTIVRNAATLGGNTMLVLAHIAEGEPFLSDLLTALAAIGAEIEFARTSTGERVRLDVGQLIAQAAADPAMHRDLLLLAYHLPAGEENDVVLAQKVALREVNAHSLVNATTRLRVGENLVIQDPVLVYGGIAPYPWRPEETEAELAGRALSLDGFPALAEVLRGEVGEQLELNRSRMAGLPSEGITDAYRAELAVAFLYKALVNALLQRAPDDVPPAVRSSGEITWGRWPVSHGTQHCKIQRWKAPVSQPYVKLMALYQTTGRLRYTHEIELPPSAVNAAFVQSRRALADYALTVPGRPGPATRDDVAAYLSQRFDAFIALLTHEDIPEHGVNLQGMGSDQPLLTDRRVSYVGQAIALVIAEGEQDAIAIAEHASEHCVDYRSVDWTAPWNEPVLSLDRAIEIRSVFPDFPKTASWAAHVWKITRPGSRFEWATPDKNALDETIAVRTADVDGVECTVVESTQRCGGQAHFYMETQACVAVPLVGGRLLVQPSTQSPAEMHQTVAMTLGVEHNRVEVRVNPVGGGYGGKTEQTRFVAGPAALAAHVLERPVRLVLKREHDTAMIGKRHAFYGQYQIAIDKRHGRIRGFQCRMWGDGGAFYDCSYIVSNCIQLRADNAYRVPNFENQIDVCRTNTAPSTAFRAFGDIQGKLLTENAIDDAAFAAGLSAEVVRFANFYERGDVTPFGQALSYCYMKEVWEYLIEVSGFERQKAEVEGFNRGNRWRKRGIAMVPVKYGSGYNLVQLEQAMAYVVVHAGDGSVTIHQGGVEMGQGALTIIEQVASYVLNVPMDLLHVEGPNTSIIPNPVSTGASTGTAYNATAVKRACQKLRERLTEFGYRMLNEYGQDWCAQRGIDFWSHGEQGWAAQAETPEPPNLVWQNLVSLAYQQRVSLNVAFVAPIRGGETPVPAMKFKPLKAQRPIPGIDVDPNARPPGPVDSFTGFTYSAACSVVEVDVLTGEVKVLSSDIVYDTGWSLNPAIDIGQVEGAFVQGLGYVLSERLVFQPDGEERGTLTSDNTWRYKLPATATIPLKFNTYLFPRDRVADVPEDGNELFSSKEVGEPPLVLATSVFFAIKAAVRASRLERGLDGLFRLDAPATVQEVRRACQVAAGELESSLGR
jgi:xanthine dehydrogenase/oxidase